MNSPYRKSFRISLAAHLGVLLLLCISGLFNGCHLFKERRKIPDLAVEFTIEIPESYLQTAVAEQDTPPPPLPEPEFAPEPEKKPEPEKPKPVKEPIVKSTTIVEKPTNKKQQEREIIPLPPSTKTVPNPKTKTPKEIAKLLELGATSSDHTSIPGENERSLLSIKQALYAAWIRPSAEHRTGRAAEIRITFDRNGAIREHKLIQSSGNTVLDNSALAAVTAVPAFRNITSGFLKAYPTVTIEFQLD